jgi:hypothetical protein
LDLAIKKDAIFIASYGKQIQRIGDALIVSLKHVTLSNLPPDDKKGDSRFKCMLYVANVKHEHDAMHILRPPLA